MKLFIWSSCVFPSFSHFGRPKPVFPRTVFTGKYRGKNRVLSKTLQPWLFNTEFVWENVTMQLHFISLFNTKMYVENGFPRKTRKSILPRVKSILADPLTPCIARTSPAGMVLTITHWGRVTHICVSNLTIIGSDNGLSPGRRQAII